MYFYKYPPPIESTSFGGAYYEKGLGLLGGWRTPVWAILAYKHHDHIP